MKVLKADTIPAGPAISPLFTGSPVTRQTLLTPEMSSDFNLAVVNFSAGGRRLTISGVNTARRGLRAKRPRPWSGRRRCGAPTPRNHRVEEALGAAVERDDYAPSTRCSIFWRTLSTINRNLGPSPSRHQTGKTATEPSAVRK